MDGEPPDWSDEFQERRRETWLAVRWWVAAECVVLLWWSVLTIAGRQPDPSSIWWWVTFVVFGAGIARVTYVVHTIYRCPSCGEMPMDGNGFAGTEGIGYSEGLLLNPKLCRKCGVRLGR